MCVICFICYHLHFYRFILSSLCRNTSMFLSFSSEDDCHVAHSVLAANPEVSPQKVPLRSLLSVVCGHIARTHTLTHAYTLCLLSPADLICTPNACQSHLSVFFMLINHKNIHQMLSMRPWHCVLSQEIDSS